MRLIDFIGILFISPAAAGAVMFLYEMLREMITGDMIDQRKMGKGIIVLSVVFFVLFMLC